MRHLHLLIMGILFLSFCGQAPDNTNENETVGQEEPKSGPTAADPMDNKGIGPVTSVQLGPIDEAMVAEGKAIYDELCTACHKPDVKFIGPSPAGILSRRSPEWIMNMILNPDGMVKEDPIAKKLLVEYNMAPMANQGLDEDQARKILEYFRTLD